MPGPAVASKPAGTETAGSRADELVSKLRSPFGTATKKRKPAQSGKPANPLTAAAGVAAAGMAATAAGVAATVKTKPTTKRPPSRTQSAQAGRQDSPEARRDAQLVLSRIEPWSVMKFSFIVSLLGWVVLFIVIAVLYYALRAFGVFHYLEQTVFNVTSSKGNPGSNAAGWFSSSTVLGFTMLVGAVNVILITAIATLGSVVYNLITHISGGVEVTLREAD
jgi:hypothetical protein